ncbi:pyruvate, phosphate dikinase [Isoptericola sp. NEAU-Y5]|uniref:Pyruvate, phosphate dikinase n=1 Tax=Isoptericola luteus TaxID=2879484 RepID=A0ABS7ZH22_9MICO|nr:pyruvate, phosphate dikinase [Isoptericola sp. NEAU-Y5]
MLPVVPLHATTAAHGGKAATLGRLHRLGLPVPDGFVVPAEVAVEHLPAAVGTGLGELTGTERADAAVAVRSSASDEDGARTSAAGQYETTLGVVGVDDVVAAVVACRASSHGVRATAYHAAMSYDAGRPADGAQTGVEVAVVVQRLVDARVAGVLFTAGFDGGRTVIEASWGLGESVVQGAVDPDRWTVVAGRVVDHRTGSKRTRVDRPPAGAGTVVRDVRPADRDRPCLEDATVLAVAALGERVADLLGGPQDVEWAVDDDGTLWLLQARPVTATLPPDRCERAMRPVPGAIPGPSPAHSESRDRPGAVLTGVAGSSGWATGPARVVRGPDDFAAVRPGDVLVCRETDPAWTPLFGVAAAVVTETGGLLSHAAIVARELRLPAVLGVPGAVRALHGAGTVDVDGDAGTVTLEPPGAKPF